MKKRLLMFCLCCLPLVVQADSLTSSQQDEVRDLVRETLIKNPDIIMEAINELKKQQQEQHQEREQATLDANKAMLFDDRQDPYRGAEKPALTVAYFSDFNCAFCKRQDIDIEKILKTFPQVRIVYKDLPILGESSREAAEMALAVHKKDPEKYALVHKKLSSKPGKHNSQSINAAFKSEGFDVNTLKKGDMNSIDKQLNQNIQLAARLGIRGTPALVFSDKVVGGYVDEKQLAAMIKERLKRHSQSL